MKKVFLILISVILLLASIPVAASAAQVDDELIQPLWDNTQSITANITFNTDGAIANALVQGKVGTTKIAIDIYVYRQVGSSWVYVTEAHDSKSARVFNLNCDFNATAEVYYRADYTVTVTKSGTDEVINKTIYRTATVTTTNP